MIKGNPHSPNICISFEPKIITMVSFEKLNSKLMQVIDQMLKTSIFMTIL